MTKLTLYLKRHWLAALLLLAGLYFQVFQVCGLDLENMAGDLGDTRFIMAIVEYNYQWLTGNYDNYWDGFFMYPDKAVISYSDNLLGSLPFYALCRVSGADYMNAFQLLVVISHILNFAVTYFCFIRLGHHPYGAALGAFCFAFNLGLANLYNHPQFSFRFFVPLFFFFLHRYMLEGKFRLLLWSVLALVYQFYLTIYVGYFTVICGAAYVLGYSAVFTRNIRTLKKQGSDLLRVTVPGLLLLSPLIYQYVRRGLSTGYYNDYEFYMQHIPRLSSYLKAFDGAWLWQPLRHTDVYSAYSWQHELFPGLTVYLVLAAAILLALRGNRQMLALLLTVILLVGFTTYYHGHTMYGYLMKIPGLKAVRVVSRFFAVTIFFGAWLLSAQGTLIFTARPLLRNAALCLMPLFLVLDNATMPEFYRQFTQEVSRNRVNELQYLLNKAEAAKTSRPVAFLSNDTVDVHFHNIDAMLCALQNGRKTVNGYSSSCGRYFGPFWRKPGQVSLRYWCLKMYLHPDSVLVIGPVQKQISP